MTWKQRRQISIHLRASLWIVPFAAMALELVFVAVTFPLDRWLDWPGLHFGAEGAKALAGTVITLSLSFIVFTFGSLLVAVQVASGQYTPRVIATTLLRNNVIRYTAGLFVFSLLFAVKALNHTNEEHVPELIIFVTGVLGLACLAAFLFLIDYAARLLRPVSLVRHVGEQGMIVIDEVYPEKIDVTPAKEVGEQDAGPVTRTILHQGTSAIIVAVDVPRLMNEARKANGVIELVPQVGDFVGSGEPLFDLHVGGATIQDEILRDCVIFGSERTLEQDPLFALRVLVDIAIKALSAAINDPTTAVLAIDQLQRLLGRAGRRNLRTDQLLGERGSLRVIFRAPDWEDFVNLACCEIRACGAGNMQIARRMRAMLVNLREILPQARQEALCCELDRLDRMVEKLYVLPEDLALARIPDSQGLGGSTRMNTAKTPA